MQFIRVEIISMHLHQDIFRSLWVIQAHWSVERLPEDVETTDRAFELRMISFQG